MIRCLFLLCALCITPFKAWTQTASPVDFVADELVYDRSLNLIIARGNVSAKQDKTTLRANHMNYDLTDGVLIASGNVEIDTPDGGLMKANYAKLKGDLKEGIIKQITFKMADQSILKAQNAQHIDSNFTEFNNISYSSCDFCLDGTRFWEIKSKKMIHDKKSQNMEAQNAILTISELPVAYIPYFSYPDPSVKRRSGFLFPSFVTDHQLGVGLNIPYYWEIDPYTDLLFSPTIATKGILWQGVFRHNFTDASMNFSGSQVNDDGTSRYNIKAGANWDMTDVWRSSIRINRVSDDTYLRSYDISGMTYDSWLRSDVNIEALTPQTYFSAEIIEYQNLRYDVSNSSIAQVLPLISFEHNTTPMNSGWYWSLGGSMVDLTRKAGDDTQRTSLDVGGHLPGITSFGVLYNFDATVNVDRYQVKDYLVNNTLFSGKVYESHPQASLTASYPLVSIGDTYSQILEPIVMGVVAPNTVYSEKIPNNDSRELEFDDTFLFSENRLVGYDRVEPGSRISYGLKWSLYGQKTGYISALVGQSYRFTNKEFFPAGSGLEKKISDIVGRITMRPSDFLSLEYAFRMNHQTFTLDRNEVDLRVGNALLRVGANYINLKGSMAGFSNIQAREELNFWANSALTRYWSVGYNQRIDLAKGGGLLEIGGYLRYEDECFALETGIRKNYTYDRDYSGGTSFRLMIELKPLGGFEF